MIDDQCTGSASPFPHATLASSQGGWHTGTLAQCRDGMRQQPVRPVRLCEKSCGRKWDMGKWEMGGGALFMRRAKHTRGPNTTAPPSQTRRARPRPL